MGFGDIVKSFIGGLAGDSDAEYEQRQISRLTPEQQKLMKDLIGQIDVTKGVEAYPGRIVPGAGPLQERAFGMLENIIGDEDSLYGRGRDVIDDLFQPYDPTADRDFFETAIRRPAMQEFEDVTMPNVMERFVGQNAMDSGAARRAVAKAGGDLQMGLSAKLADILYGGRRESEARRERMVPMAADYEMSPVRAAMDVGGVQRGIERETMAEPYEKWLYSRPYANPWLQYAMPTLGLQTFDTTFLPGQASTANRLGRIGRTAGQMYFMS